MAGVNMQAETEDILVLAKPTNKLQSLEVIAKGSCRTQLDALLLPFGKHCKKWMRNVAIVDTFTLSERWSNGQSKTSQWSIHNSGANRLVYADLAEPRVLKLLVTSPGMLSVNREEWCTMASLCREDLPTCYGFVKMAIHGLHVEALITERFAFNLEDFLKKTFLIPPSVVIAFDVLHLINLSLAAMIRWSTTYQLQLCDWHTRHINFTDTDPLRLVMIDIEGHVFKPHESARQRMKGGFDPFPVSYTHLTLPTNREV